MVVGVGALTLLLAGCGDGDDTVDNGADGADPSAQEEDQDDADATDGDADTADDGDEGDSGGEVSSVDGLHVVFDGEQLAATGVYCDETGLAGGLLQVDMIEVDVATADGREGAFRAMWDIDAEHMHRVVVSFRHEDNEFETYNVDWRADEVVGDIDFEADVGASGQLELKADSELAEEHQPDGGTVEFDVDCQA